MAPGDGEVVVKRLHISGLTPHFSREALRERLASYGRVLDLVGCEDSFTNGVGQRQPYAFATIETTPPQLARCLNTLSGAIWKGAKLRVGEARPLWHDRLAKERASAQDEALRAKEHERQKRRLRKRPWIGREAETMQPVTLERVHAGEWGWKVTPAGHLVRPMHMRWTRPLPRPADADPPSRQAPARRRAPCTTIDPTRYRREHLAGPMFDAMSEEMGSWRWAWDAEAGVWRAYDRGLCVATEAGPRPRARSPVRADEWAPEPQPQAHPRPDVETADVETADVELPDTLFATEAPPEELFDAPATSGASTSGAWWDEDTSTGTEPPTTASVYSAVAAPAEAPARTPLSTRQDPGLFDLSDFSDGYEELDHAPPAATSDEHARALHVFEHLFGSEPAAPASPPADGAESDDDRADDRAVSVPPNNTSADETAVENDVHMDSLKSMFQPAQNTEAFTLLGDWGDDVELDPAMDEAVTGSGPADGPAAPEPRVPPSSTAPHSTSKLPLLTTPHTLAAGRPSLIPALLELGSSPFWKVATDEEIEAAWTEHRAELTQTYRRLHREGIKKRRRRVVGARAATAAGGLAPARGARLAA